MALQGIGRETVSCLASLGANIWACAHIIDDEFINFCNKTSSNNGIKIYPLEADFMSIESVKEMCKEIHKARLTIDGLVNVAGITKDAIFQMTSSADIIKLYDVNFTSLKYL